MDRWRSRPYWLLAGASALWIVAVLLPPWLHSAGWSGAETAFRKLFAGVCHQIPARSLSVNDIPLGVCARCFGLYVGFLVGALVLPLSRRLSRSLEDRPRLMLLFWVPMACDLLLWENVAWSRFLTGLAASFPVALFVFLAVEQLALPQLTRNSR